DAGFDLLDLPGTPGPVDELALAVRELGVPDIVDAFRRLPHRCGVLADAQDRELLELGGVAVLRHDVEDQTHRELGLARVARHAPAPAPDLGARLRRRGTVGAIEAREARKRSDVPVLRVVDLLR